MVHALYSLPDFLAAVLSYGINILTGSVIAVGILLYEHYSKKTITWGWCVGITVFSIFVSCEFAWIDEHDQVVSLKQKEVSTKQSELDAAKKAIETRRAQKAEMQRFMARATEIIEKRLPYGQNRGQLMADDPRFQQYESDANKWIVDSSTWLLQNFGEKAQQRFLDISRTEAHDNDLAESVNQTHMQIMMNLQKYRENLRLMIAEFLTGEPTH